ncbi:MAG: VWA domain-containing protein [Calditrichaeota bacterium]|nr:MAG: VWA domain-containing protein [Calditrichota bacterium]
MKKIIMIGLLLPALISSSAHSQGFIIPDNAGTLRLTKFRASIQVQENIAESSLEHEFYNPTRQQVQGVFYFPLPNGAQVTDFSMEAGGQRLQAELLDARDARKIYLDVVRKALDPALLEMVGKNAFKASIFPIPPGQSRTIRLQYSAVLPRDHNLVKLILPLRGELKVEGRVPPQPYPFGGERPVFKHEDAFQKTPFLRSIDIHLKSRQNLGNIYSPSHRIDIHRKNAHEAEISFEESHSDAPMDFVLYYELHNSDMGLQEVVYRPDKTKPGYFALLISPKYEPNAAKILPKDILWVLDVSGSMAGKKINQARTALKQWIQQLNPGDRFNLITFSSQVKMLQPQWVEVKAGSQPALAFIDAIQAKGGTNIHEALLKAFEQAGKSANAMVVFITDGLPTVGVTQEGEILRDLQKVNTGQLRVFTFGLGYDVNTRLLDGIARLTHAFSDYISPDENLEEKVSSFYEKIRYPVLTHLKLDFGGARVEDAYPVFLPDLFRGQQLIVFGRYPTAGKYRVTLSGEAQNQRKQYSHEVNFPAEQHENAFIAPLWASRKIGYLLDQMQLNGENKELRDEIISLSKEYGIVTPYTSYLIQEKRRRSGSLTLVPGRHFNAGFTDDLSRDLATVPGKSTSGIFNAVTGKEAVNFSQQKNALMQASQLASEVPAAGEVQQRRVAEKTFFLNQQNYWQDLSCATDSADIHIKFASEAYFQLLQRFQQLKLYLSVGERVILGFKGKVIKIDEQGVESVRREMWRKWFRSAR